MVHNGHPPQRVVELHYHYGHGPRRQQQYRQSAGVLPKPQITEINFGVHAKWGVAAKFTVVAPHFLMAAIRVP
jgi:hypothetical protein